ncbi:hypothetical protein GCV60_14695 [Listeria monocytogenes]|nr:hypothetical protein [Listeria monocytogenes]
MHTNIERIRKIRLMYGILLVIMLIWGIKISFFQESLISSTTLCFTLLLFAGVYLNVLVIRKRIDFFKLFGLIGIFTLLDYGFNLMGLKNIPAIFSKTFKHFYQITPTELHGEFEKGNVKRWVL